MSDYNFMPPQWVWKLIIWLSVIGVLTCLASLVFGAVWLIQHLEFKP